MLEVDEKEVTRISRKGRGRRPTQPNRQRCLEKVVNSHKDNQMILPGKNANNVPQTLKTCIPSTSRIKVHHMISLPILPCESQN